jgi:hypothetical protein
MLIRCDAACPVSVPLGVSQPSKLSKASLIVLAMKRDPHKGRANPKHPINYRAEGSGELKSVRQRAPIRLTAGHLGG